MEPNEIAALAKRVHDAEGWYLGSRSSRETRNKFWARVVGIVHYGHPVYNPTPDPRWHIKDAGGGRPQSDDVAVLMPSRHHWDFIGGVGADGYTFGASNDHGPLPLEQNVYPPPRPADAGPPPPTPPPPPPAADLRPVLDALRALDAKVERLAAALADRPDADALAETVAQKLTPPLQTLATLIAGLDDTPVTFPPYEGRVFGARLTLTPKT